MISPELKERLIKIKRATRSLRTLPPEIKNNILKTLEGKLTTKEQEILQANRADLTELSSGVTSAFRDRLTLTPARLAQIRSSLIQVAELSDPVGEVVEQRALENGLKIKRVRAPLGVIFMIFESRPNVAIEAFSLALKSGNALILRAGKEAKNTVNLFYQAIAESLSENHVSPDLFLGITDPQRLLIQSLLQEKKWIDVVVPRGGDALIEFVVEHSKIPIIKNDRGLCHLYVHHDANLEKALSILENAKKQRPGVCNAVETLLVHESIAAQFLPRAYALLSQHSDPKTAVRWFACAQSLRYLPNLDFAQLIEPESFDTEYLDYKLSCKVVKNEDEAITHIETHGSRHSEAIMTESTKTAQKFQNEIDAAAVYWNASTRFTDGFELGLGGELGISTQKLHVRGPVGLRELTSIRWLMEGNGQIRN